MPKKVIVAGSINMDIVGTVKKHPVPGETISGQALNYYPGGKGANQAVASAKSGSHTIMIGHVGEDSAGMELVNFLEGQQIELAVKTVKGPTGTALIAVATETSDNTIIVIPGANATLTPDQLPLEIIQKNDILLSHFEIPTETIVAFYEAGRGQGTLNIFNAAPAAPISDKLYAAIDILIINETELMALASSHVDVENQYSILAALQKISRPHLKVIVTIGAKGAVLFENNSLLHISGHAVKAVDTTGAGDCFCGVLCGFLAQDHDLADAIQSANRAASISVTRHGAAPSMPTKDEIIQQ